MHEKGESPLLNDVWSVSWVEAVEHAYFVEHGVSEQKEIAKLLNISEGAVSQKFKKEAQQISGRGLKELLEPIRLPELRTEILIAWGRDVVGTDAPAYGPDERKMLAGSLMRRNRPDLALKIALESLDAEEDPMERWTAALQALRCCHRLDLPGEAIQVALRLRRWGEEAGWRGLEAAARANASRAMRRTLHFTPIQVDDERLRSFHLLNERQSASPDSVDERAAWHAKELVTSEHAVNTIRVQELYGNQEAELKKILRNVAAHRIATGRTDVGRARAHQLAARIHLALGETQEGELHLRQALELGAEEPSMRLECEPLKARLAEARGDVEAAVDHLRWTVRACARYRFVYLQRMAESELARVSIVHFERRS